MTSQELHDAIIADPIAKSFADQGNDMACANQMMMSLPPFVFRYIPINIFIIWCAVTGLRSSLKQHAEDASSPLQSISLALLDMMTDTDSPGLDTQDVNIIGNSSGVTPIKGMLDQLTEAGILPANGRGSKQDLLSQAPTSPQYVSVSDVALAWDQYRPNGKINS